MTIVDQDRYVVAMADVEFLEGSYSGPVNLDRMPDPLRRKFEEYEDAVNDQVFSLLGQIEDQIGAIPFVAIFDDGREASVEDLQIFPKGGTISFKLAEPSVLGRNR